MRAGAKWVKRAVFLLVPAMAACAGAETVPGDAAEGAAAAGGSVATVFMVQNDHTNRRDVIIYLEPEGRGQRQQLGQVGVGQTGSLQATVEPGYHRLIAAHEMGDIRSDRFNIIGPSTVRWQLQTGRLQVTRR